MSRAAVKTPPPPNLQDSLAALRAEIDIVDDNLLKTLNQRAQLVHKVGDLKASQGNASIYQPAREAAIIARMQQQPGNEFGEEVLEGIYRSVISACRALEHRLKVAYLGPRGTYTEQATLKHFGESLEFASMRNLEEVFREVDSGRANYGVVPVENSTEGAVTHTLDLFTRFQLEIRGEIKLPIHHNLLLKDAARKRKIERIYGHRQSFAQCRKWLDSHMPRVPLNEVASNAEAARTASERAGAAAIASEAAAAIYGLDIVSSNIEDEADNTTLFLVIGKSDSEADSSRPEGVPYKTSLLLAARNVPGALHRLLGPLAENGIDMNKIESRPLSQSNWRYVFFIDIRGHHGDPEVERALDALRQDAALFRILGSYPEAP